MPFPFLNLFVKKPVTKPKGYEDIICLNTACMRTFTHEDRLFRLKPPLEVERYHREHMDSVGKKSILSDEYSELSDDPYGYLDDEDKTPISERERPANAELEEKNEYYYDNIGSEEPKYLSILDDSLCNQPDMEVVPDDENAYRVFLEHSAATGFVIGISDKYGIVTHEAVCPFCKSDLYPHAGLYETIIIPILGVSQSGKTVMMSKGLGPFLQEAVPKMMSEGSVYDEEGRKYLKTLEIKLKNREKIEASNAVERLMWMVRSAEKKVVLLTFDMPGEYIANSNDKDAQFFRETNLRNVLQCAKGLIIIISPEQITKLIKDNATSYDSEEENIKNKVKLRQIMDMLRLVERDSDPAKLLQKKQIPTSFILTKIDMLEDDYEGPVSIHMLKDEQLKNKIEEVISYSPYQCRGNKVSFGDFSYITGITEEVFDGLIKNEKHGLYDLLGRDRKLACFGTSIQGSDTNADVVKPPKRPYDPFYWLFTQIGLFESQS